MSSKQKLKEVKSSKKDPEKEKGKGKGKGKEKEKGEGDKDNAKKEKKQVVTLWVALYQPEYGNLHHWALYLDTHNYVYQVRGEPMDFTASVISGAIPMNSSRYVESVEVGEINPNDVVELDRLIRATPVQNDVQSWCCQDYVMEALEALNEEQIVDDEDYQRARRRLERKFNH